MPARRDDSVKEALIAAALDEIANSGLGGFSLRSVAAAATKSTTAIFHHFGDKNGLMAAVAERALSIDDAYHASLRNDLAGLALDRDALADFLADYLRPSSEGGAAYRIWQEFLFNGALWPDSSLFLARWRDHLALFWQPLLDAAGLSHLPARFIVAYCIMEKSYASVLKADVGSRLLIRETIRAFLASASDSIQYPVIGWQESTATPPQQIELREDGGLGGKLLDVAVREILEKGVTALNHRSLTAEAGASPAMIVYHFGDKASLESAAIWRALLVGLPDYLNTAHSASGGRQSMAQWKAVVGRTLQASSSAQVAGFYVGYARIVGQTCLLARRDPAYIPLVKYLRAIEGIGIFNAGRTIWPPTLQLSRAKATCFALWAKGYATLNEATGGTKATAVARDLAAAADFFTHRHTVQ